MIDHRVIYKYDWSALVFLLRGNIFLWDRMSQMVVHILLLTKKYRKVKIRYFFHIIFFVMGLNFSYGVEQSSWRTEIYENPYLTVGYDFRSGTLTGYVASLRTAPGETNECKLSFKGDRAKKSNISVKVANAATEKSKLVMFSGQLEIMNNRFQLVINKSQLPGDCDWVLPFIGYPTVEEKSGQVIVKVSPMISGDWRAVGVIQAKKAYFHQSPDEATVEKAYLVAGDVLHIYGEKPGWYFVKFQGLKKEVIGWVRVRDTIQF